MTDYHTLKGKGKTFVELYEHGSSYQEALEISGLCEKQAKNLIKDYNLEANRGAKSLASGEGGIRSTMVKTVIGRDPDRLHFWMHRCDALSESLQKVREPGSALAKRIASEIQRAEDRIDHFANVEKVRAKLRTLNTKVGHLELVNDQEQPDSHEKSEKAKRWPV